MTQSQPIFLAPSDAARRLGISVSRIAQLDREGLLPAARDSAGRRLFDPDIVERFAEERESRARSLRPSESRS
jgi:DNA-binding transcriptional MerR regulator